MLRISEQTAFKNSKVSVAMITYNHEKFIAQAIESVLMQETNFPVELIIGEDCSTDGTRKIVREYAAKYPNIIRALLPEKNLGMQKNFSDVQAACQGDFLAFLEGDDYWTDPQKLQSQADFLSVHPESALCHHLVTYFDEPSARSVGMFPPSKHRIEQCSADLLAEGNFIQTCSLMVRRSLIPKPTVDFARLKLADWPLCVMLGQYGWIGYIDRNMATYRLHTGSTWSSKTREYRSTATQDMVRFLALTLKRSYRDPWVKWFLNDLNSDMACKSKSGAVGLTAKAGLSFVWYGFKLKPRRLPWIFYRFGKLFAGSCNRRYNKFCLS